MLESADPLRGRRRVRVYLSLLPEVPRVESRHGQNVYPESWGGVPGGVVVVGQRWGAVPLDRHLPGRRSGCRSGQPGPRTRIHQVLKVMSGLRFHSHPGWPYNPRVPSGVIRRWSGRVVEIVWGCEWFDWYQPREHLPSYPGGFHQDKSTGGTNVPR